MASSSRRGYHKVVSWGLVYTLLATFTLATNNNMLEYEIQENVSEGTLIGNIIEDTDLTSRYNQTVINLLRFSFLNMGEESDLFDLDASSAELKTATLLDRDEICPRQETCTIYLDIAMQPVIYFEAVKVKIDILDINDNAPMFQEPEMDSSLSESTMPSVLFPVTRAIDPDSPTFSIQRYQFFSDTDKFELRIRNNTDGTKDLHLALVGLLDREVEDSYEMRVIAYDGGNPPKTGSLTIKIVILDVNDNSPRFDNATYAVSIPEDMPVNTTIARVHATDPDADLNGEVRYGFTSSRSFADQFGINPVTGEIYLREPLDYEFTSMYNLAVTAQDRGTDSIPTPTTVVVQVLDVNDHAPAITINAFSPDQIAQIPEDAEASEFVAHISVFDQDQGQNGNFTCSLNDPLFELVNLFGTEFKVITVAPLDREEQAVHFVEITCMDYGVPQRISRKELQVVVADRNDNGPTFKQHTYYATIEENNSVDDIILQVVAVDLDEGSNANIRYELDINARNDFTIDHSTGVITSNIRYDRELQETYEFRVFASDNGAPPRNDSATVIVDVVDVDDNRPMFTDRTFTFTVLENQGSNTNVGQVTAQDGDSERYNAFTFHMPEGQSATPYFKVDSHTGMISTRRVLDRELREAFTLNVVVRSANHNQPNDTARVIVYIDDMNDNDPVIDFPTVHNHSVDISNRVPVGYVVTRILAHDDDIDSNAQLFYSITEGNANGEFVIGSTTGDLFVNTKFHDISYHRYELIIMVQDSGQPSRLAINPLNINVNETIPYYADPLGGTTRGISDIQLIIIICVILGTVVIATLLIVAIVVLKRRDQKTAKPQYFERSELSLTVSNSPATKIPADGLVGTMGHDGDALVPASPMPDYSSGSLRRSMSPTGTLEKKSLPPGGPLPHEIGSPLGTEKDSDSGCCPDMGVHECGMGPHEEDHRACNPNLGGPGSILKIKCYHPPTHRRIPRNQQSSFSDWLLSESQNLKNSGHAYKVGDRGEPVGKAEPGMLDPRADPNRHSLKSVRFNEGRQGPADLEDPDDISVKQPRKVMLPAQNNYRHYGPAPVDSIPEEPDHIQDITGHHSPAPGPKWSEDGSLV